MSKEPKTKPTEVSPDAFVEAAEPSKRRDEGRTLLALMRRLTGLEPRMWGPSIIGFGSYRYTYDSGRSGESLRIGFSPRKGALTVYCIPGYSDTRMQERLAALGPHTTGQSCLYIKSLAAVDMGVLESILADSWAEMARRYPDAA